MKYCTLDHDGVVTGYGKNRLTAEQIKMDDDDQRIVDYETKKQDKIAQEKNRQKEINQEKSTTGLKNISVQSAHNKIDEIFENATTVAALRTATVIALKKIIPYVLE